MHRQQWKIAYSIWSLLNIITSQYHQKKICRANPLGITSVSWMWNFSTQKRVQYCAIYIYLFFMTVPPCEHQTGPYTQRGGFWRFELEFCCVWWVNLPPKSMHEYVVSGPQWGRQAFPLFRVTSDKVLCRGSGVDSWGHRNARLLHKLGFCFWEWNQTKFMNIL